MRFLLSLPLPLLLILIQFVHSSYASGDKARLTETSRTNKSTANSSLNFEGLSLAQVKAQLVLDRATRAQLQLQVNAAQKAFEDKWLEASGPIGEYNKSKEEWERLDAIVKEKSIELDKLKKIAKDAGEKETKSEKIFSGINKTVSQQEKELKVVEDQLNELDKNIAKIKDTPNRLTTTNENVKKLIADEKSMQELVNKLAGEIPTKTTAVDGCKITMDTWQEVFNEKGCEFKAKTGECEEPNKYLNEWRTKWQDAKIELNQTVDGHSKAQQKLTALTTAKSDAESDLKSLERDAKHIDELVAEASAPKPRLERTKEELEQPLVPAREARRKALEDLDSAKAIKIQAESNVTSYSSDELTKAQKALFNANVKLLPKQAAKEKFDKPLRDLEKVLKDLQKQLANSELRVGALERQEKKLNKDAGSDSLIAVLGFSGLAIIVLIAAIIAIVMCVLKRKEKNKKPPTDTNTNRADQTPTLKQNSKEELKPVIEAQVAKPPISKDSFELTEELNVINVDDLPETTEQFKHNKQHIKETIKQGETRVTVMHKAVNFNTKDGSETIFRNGSRMSCQNAEDFGKRGADGSPNRCGQFVFNASANTYESMELRKGLTAGQFSDMLGTLKKYEATKKTLTLERAPAGSDPNETGPRQESGGAPSGGQQTGAAPRIRESRNEGSIDGRDGDSRSDSPQDEDSRVEEADYVVAPHERSKKWTQKEMAKRLRKNISWYKKCKAKPLQYKHNDRAFLIVKARNMLKNEPALCEIQAGEFKSVRVYGDLRGNLDVFLKDCASIGEIGSNEWMKHKYVFLGNYIDCGHHSVDVCMILFLMKLCYPENIVLLRGYYELKDINEKLGFLAMLQKTFDHKRKNGSALFTHFNSAFAEMPYACLVGEKMLIVHSGIPELSETVNDLKKEIKNIHRPILCPDDKSLPIALLTYAPERGLPGFKNDRDSEARRFGEKQLSDFVGNFGLNLVVRAGQIIQSGSEFFDERRLVSLCSTLTPKENHATVMVIERNNGIRFKYFYNKKLTAQQYLAQIRANNFTSSLYMNNDNLA